MYAALPPPSVPEPSKYSRQGRWNREDRPFDHTRGGPPTPPFDRDQDVSYARRLQREFDSEDIALKPCKYFRQGRCNKENCPFDHIRRGPPAPLFGHDHGLSYARRLQREFDSEDRALSVERIKLSQTVQRVFMCGICMEEMPEDSVARPDPCGHAFCRECMRGYVSTRLEEHRFPILCPTCTAGKGEGKGGTGGTRTFSSPSSELSWHGMNVVEVSQTLALDLGLTDEQFVIWTEMEMGPFSVLLHCRKYARSICPRAY